MVEFDKTRSEFPNTELQAGLTFCRLALDAQDAAKRARNRINARKAYRAILHFSKDAALTPSQARTLKELKQFLDRLAKRKRRPKP